MSERQRCFVALEASPSWRAAIGTARATLAAMAPRARVTPDARLHITLRFLGSLGAEQVASAQAALREVAAGARPLDVRLAGAGTFGRPPHVLWLGIDEADEPAVAQLAEALDLSLRGRGFEARDRPFAAHLTLARASRRSDRTLTDAAKALDGFRAPAAAVDDVVLFRSNAEADGPHYEVIARYTLGG